MPSSHFCPAKFPFLYCQANSFVQGGQGPPAPLSGAASYSLEAGQSSDRAEVYWSLAPDTGAISLRGDLTNELYFEYRLVVRAQDTAVFGLFSLATLGVAVQQVVNLPPNMAVAFSERNTSTQVLENIAQEAVLKVLPLTKKPVRNIRLGCKVAGAVDRAGVRADQLFRGQLNAAKDCVLVLARSGLDPETMPSYTVTLHLATLPGLVSPQGQEAVARVEVLDRNDNPPVWQQEQGDRGGLIPPSVQLVSVEPGLEAGTSVAKLLATDRDSGELGRVSYSLSADTPAPARPYFSVAPDSGEVKMAQPLEEAD